MGHPHAPGCTPDFQRTQRPPAWEAGGLEQRCVLLSILGRHEVRSRKNQAGSGFSAVGDSRNGNVSKRNAGGSFEFQGSSFETKAGAEAFRPFPTEGKDRAPGRPRYGVEAPDIVSYH